MHLLVKVALLFSSCVCKYLQDKLLILNCTCKGKPTSSFCQIKGFFSELRGYVTDKMKQMVVIKWFIYNPSEMASNKTLAYSAV